MDREVASAFSCRLFVLSLLCFSSESPPGASRECSFTLQRKASSFLNPVRVAAWILRIHWSGKLGRRVPALTTQLQQSEAIALLAART